MTATAKVLQTNPYIPVAPTLKQLSFLSRPEREVFFGGAAGGGKSESLLMASLMYVDFPDYAAIIFRRTFTDLALEGALMDRAHDWLSNTPAKWHERERRWEFPSGATLTFGYLDAPRDWRRYDSAEFGAILFDEATQLRAHDYNALTGRLRRKQGSPVPLRIRAASNPGGESHEFFGERFVTPRESHPERVFVPALLEDNPHLDREQYEATLLALADADPTLYRQRRFGEWIRDEGESIFHREWWDEARFDLSTTSGADARQRYISVDTAMKDTDSSDYTACVVFEVLWDYRVRVVDAWRRKLQFPGLLAAIRATVSRHDEDGKLKAVVIEDKVSGTSALQTLKLSAEKAVARKLVAFQPKGSKDERARQASAWCRQGLVEFPIEARWLLDLEEELYAIPNSEYRDYGDAFGQGVLYLELILAHRARMLRKIIERVA